MAFAEYPSVGEGSAACVSGRAFDDLRMQFPGSVVRPLEDAVHAAAKSLNELPRTLSAQGDDFVITVAADKDDRRRRSARPVIEILCSTPEQQDLARDALTLRGMPVRCVVVGEIACLSHRRRPFLPGDSISHALNGDDHGTLGCLVRGRKKLSRTLFALSNAHVLHRAGAGSAKGDHIVQPGCRHGGLHPGDAIGQLDEPLSLHLAGVDAALARVEDSSTAFPKIRRVGKIGKTHAEPVINLPVHKYGATTQYRRGVVQSLLTVPLKVRICGVWCEIHDVIRFKTATHQPFADHGDSGSLIVTQECNRPVALLFAGDRAGAVYGIRIDTVLRRLSVQIVRTSAELRRCR